MRQSVVVGMCWAVITFAPGCPKDDKQGAGGTAEDGGSAPSGQQMSGSGGASQHGGTGDPAHPGSGGASGAGNGGANGGGAGSTGTTGHDAGMSQPAGSGGEPAKDAGMAPSPADAGADAGGSSAGSCGLQCDPGTHCELVQVQCIRAPCPPQPECVKDVAPSCGGFAGLQCPGGAECVDDPTDSCDPMNGGADCGGICVCNKAASCVQGKHWDGSANVCDCVADNTGSAVPCGKKMCNAGQICCSATCGICGSAGGVCPAIACLPSA